MRKPQKSEKKKKKKKEEKKSEFGEMVITSAFQADFVGSSPIIRKKKKKKVFRGVIEHVKEEMALYTAISQYEVDGNPEKAKAEVLDTIHAKAYKKVNQKLGIETS